MFDTPALQERNCANQCKVVLSNNICKHIYTDGSGLFQDNNALIHRE